MVESCGQRREEKQRATLLPMVAKRIIVRANGEIYDYESHSPFVCLQTLADGLQKRTMIDVVRNRSA